MKRVRIATRKSPLALWQANHVASLIRKYNPGVEMSLVEMSTEGDRFLSAPLSRIGGKGLFVKEIEQALLEGAADVAVHSLKDMTSTLPASLVLTAVVHREDPRDAWVSRQGTRFAELPKGARVGTSSLRRMSQLLERRPDLEIVSLRGNVQSRLRKMEEQQLAGVVLAAAGLSRLELEDRVTEYFDVETSIPAVGQGVLAIECRESDSELREILSALEDPTTRVEISAERAFLARLEGGCSVPLAGHALLHNGVLRVRGLIGRPDGKRVVRGERAGAYEDALKLGRELAEELLAAGGAEILAEFARASESR